MRDIRKNDRFIYLCCFATAFTLYHQTRSSAHEGHAALPSTGVVLEGGQLLISPAATDAIGMTTEKITLGDMQHTLRVNARIELPWSGQAKVTTLTDGKIERVLVRPGDAVKVGQVLAEVESLQLDTLQTELLQTAAEIQLLERLVSQREGLVARGGLADKVLLATKAELQQKAAQREILRRKLNALGLDNKTLDAVQNSGTTVRSIAVVSPIAGTIDSVETQPGQLVESSDHLFDIVDLSHLYIVGEVLESDSHLVRKGMPIEITMAGVAGRDFTGHIDHIRMKMDEAKRLLQAVVIVDNHQVLLRPGMFGRMAIHVAAAKQSILCPTSAVVETENGAYVFRREGEGKFSRRAIQMGMRSPGLVVVESGLFPGQQVINGGTHLLAAMFDGSGVGDQGAGISRRIAEVNGGRSEVTGQRPDDEGLTTVLTATASVELPTGQRALATSLIEGRVVNISASPGELVQAGSVLAEVESQQLHTLQLELLQTAGKIMWTETELERLRPLANSGVTSARDFWQRELALKTLSHQAASLERRLALIGLRAQEIERLRSGELSGSGDTLAVAGRIAVRSPIAGRVAEIGVTLGQIVHAHDKLFEIQNTKRMWIRALALEKDAIHIQVGQDAAVTFPAHPGLRIRGEVVRLAPQLISRQRVLPLWIEIANPDEFLKDGMLARVEIRGQPSGAADGGPRPDVRG